MFPIMTDREFVEDSGLRCPVCRDLNIGMQEDEPAMFNSTTIHVEMECRVCRSAWTEIYYLSGYDYLSKGEVENG